MVPRRDQKVDLVPGRLTGYRQWNVVGIGTESNPFRLASLTARTVWPWTPEHRARCLRSEIGVTYPKFREPRPHDPQDVPNVDCSCGIYASYVIEPSERVTGVIEAWGPTVIGEHAFRARSARLVALCQDPAWALGFLGRASTVMFRLRDLGQLYRVPVFIDTDEVRRKFPASDVSALLPPEPQPEPEYPEPGYVDCWCGGDPACTVARQSVARSGYSRGGYVAPARPALYPPVF